MDLRQTITDQTDVALTLTHHVSTTEASNKNLVFSPLSVQVILSMIASGSSGSTRDQVLSFLKSNSSDDLNKFSSEVVSLVLADGSEAGGPKLKFSNGVWADQTLQLKLSFKHVVDDVYKASSNQVDFLHHALEVAAEVNSWVENQTGGLIKELLPPGTVDNTTRLVFGNALYFKGAWSEKFDASETKEDDFHLLNGGSVKVPYMTSKKKQFVKAADGFKVLCLPYKQGEDKRQFSMYFFLPDAKDGLAALAEKIKSGSGFLNKHLPLEKNEVGVFKLPRFKISFGFEASEVLKGLGVELPFSEGGLTEMADSSEAQKLYVSSIFHKAFIEVNEEGTEAAAATGAVVMLRCLRSAPRVDFVADHPFMFLIKEDMTGVVIFAGQVLNPLDI